MTERQYFDITFIVAEVYPTESGVKVKTADGKTIRFPKAYNNINPGNEYKGRAYHSEYEYNGRVVKSTWIHEAKLIGTGRMISEKKWPYKSGRDEEKILSQTAYKSASAIINGLLISGNIDFAAGENKIDKIINIAGKLSEELAKSIIILADKIKQGGSK